MSNTTCIHLSTKRDREGGEKRLPSMQAFVKVYGVLSGDNLLLSPFAGLVHHCCRSAFSDPTTGLHLPSVAAANETIRVS